mmetsp:Transcript_7730/g.23400  ORF Transcript_7730/g.23400 Transcript_7730/m.23400 type:complete len:492 (+) Transcript_7730:502-1977(+)|eukprot:CAMPEP_0198729420 /NCGR_PEP_ID=MMETSP1475-20131203/18045_1 /TAXON_ID= ORGANISM="Unidentified sp., Strain CCMP1999" /NCGR_SAMPLE_ID=MMETSP1475 /ASSEMBLY_ACC=CAM_ASM_001111 /LENGTH=491 /DNA_ID=CAMNT_0044492061 /DNA_START=491 /DNA_END=1966 /DNA_ORIENTATION=-
MEQRGASDVVTELCGMCRVGDLDGVKKALSLGVDINARDRWDATPLYYACLTGRVQVVKFLLESGALCDERTFDGERCYLAALTLEVRSTLQQYGNRILPYSNDQFYRFLVSSQADTSLTNFVLKGRKGDKVRHIHSVVLFARCRMLQSSLCSLGLINDRESGAIEFQSESVASAFADYLYRGTVNICDEEVDNLLQVARGFGFHSLIRLLESKPDSRPRKHRQASCSRRRKGTDIEINTAENALWQDVRKDFASLAQMVLVADDPSVVLSDAHIQSENRTFYGHKVFLYRCKYFRAMDRFNEFEGKEYPSVYQLTDFSDEAVQHFLWLLYCDRAQSEVGEDLELALEILQLCKMLLAPSHLFDKIEASLVKHQFRDDDVNIIDVLIVSELFCLKQLRMAAAVYIESRLWHIKDLSFRTEIAEVDQALSPDFLMLVFEDIREEALRRKLADEEFATNEREQAGVYVDDRLEGIFGEKYAQFAAVYDQVSSL